MSKDVETIKKTNINNLSSKNTKSVYTSAELRSINQNEKRRRRNRYLENQYGK